MSKKTVDANGDLIVLSRAEDHSFWMYTSFILDKYKLLWITLLAILTAAGFDFTTPKSANEALQHQIDTLKAMSQTAIRERTEIKNTLDKLLKVPCLAKDRNVRDLELIGITCTTISPASNAGISGQP